MKLIVSSNGRNIVNADNVKGLCIVEDYKDEMYVVFADDYEMSFHKTLDGAKKQLKALSESLTCALSGDIVLQLEDE